MIKLKNLFFISIVTISTFGCSGEITTKKELFRYLSDRKHGLSKESDHNGITTSASYIPYQLINSQNPKSRRLNNSRSTSSYLYFVARFSKNGKELLGQLDLNTYSDMVQILSFRMAAIISLHSENNIYINAEDCFFQQTFGLTSSNELLIVFDKKKLGNARKFELVIEEFGLGVGNLTYEFLKSDIDKLNFKI